ncbi:hypothetical protein FB451DRAFT_65685 [Mycena latifolia]|nr:hypothetical protein FB451DRAFT_65685 [Mycena latifolia]
MPGPFLVPAPSVVSSLNIWYPNANFPSNTHGLRPRGRRVRTVHRKCRQGLRLDPADAELVRFKSENRRLESVNRELVHQLALRNEKLQAYLPCHVAPLPHEILLIIFRYALPPAWALKGGDTSFSPFPQSAWSMDLRMKLTILRVSKTWHQIGLGLLYESIALRRIGQLPSFVDP